MKGLLVFWVQGTETVSLNCEHSHNQILLYIILLTSLAAPVCYITCVLEGNPENNHTRDYTKATWKVMYSKNRDKRTRSIASSKTITVVLVALVTGRYITTRPHTTLELHRRDLLVLPRRLLCTRVRHSHTAASSSIKLAVSPDRFISSA